MMNGTAPTLSRVFIGFVLLWLVLDRSATLLGSTRGEAGVLVCGLVLATALLVEVSVSRSTPRQAFRVLGFAWSGTRSVLVGVVLSLLLLSFYPIFSWVSGTRLSMRHDWLWLLPGLFSQSGIAEEMVFRGYVFRHLRATRPFWPATLLALLPFTAVHLLLFFHLSWPLALASTLLALAVSLPLAYLFEQGRQTLWVCALLHFIMQGSIKLVDIPEPLLLPAAVAWMMVSAVVPYLAFAVRLPPDEATS